MKVAVIGGGVSGIIASIHTSKNNEVTIFERNNSLLKKLLLTGNGRCNYFNSNQDISNYNSSNIEILKEIINKENMDKVLNFYDSIGIIPKIKNGYYYPHSNTSFSVKEALIKEAKLNNVKIVTDFLIDNIEKINDKFIINNDQNLVFDVVILSTGSCAAPKTGSDGIGYKLASNFNHNILKPLPSLVQLKGEGNYFKDWNGIRTDVKVSLYENDQFIKEEVGEIQLTNYGLSGICIFNLSGRLNIGLARGNKEDILINFLPFTSNIKEFIENRNMKVKNRNIMELLEGLLNYKLVQIILKKSNIKDNSYYSDLTDKQKELLYENLTQFKVNIIGTNTFESAQVCSGGVPLNEININTMESLKVKNLYIIGELLDVDGLCGGYNITFATLSAILAGTSIKEN